MKIDFQWILLLNKYDLQLLMNSDVIIINFRLYIYIYIFYTYSSFIFTDKIIYLTRYPYFLNIYHTIPSSFF